MQEELVPACRSDDSVFSHPTVFQVFREWQLRNKSIISKNYTGQKRLVNERVEKRVACIIRSNRKETTGQITTKLIAGVSQSISLRTMRQTLQTEK